MKYTQRRLCIATGCFALLNLTACNERPVSTMPPVQDVQAVVEPKPKPPVDILTDPTANDRYNTAIEAYADRLRAGGLRLCGFFKKQGMAIEC